MFRVKVCWGFVCVGAFVPVRRARKLPGSTIGIEYMSGYYHGRFEVHDDAIPRDSRVVIIDDLVATVRSLYFKKTIIERNEHATNAIIGKHTSCDLSINETIRCCRC